MGEHSVLFVGRDETKINAYVKHLFISTLIPYISLN